MSVDVLLAFVIAIVLMAATPGPAMALILQRAGLSGFRRTIPTVLGIEVGLLFWAVAAGTGMAALVAASEVAFWVLKVGGAGLLVYLGVRAILRGRRVTRVHVETADQNRTGSRSFLYALGIQLANPKAALLVLALYPQFIPAGGPVLVWSLGLGFIQILVETLLYLALAASVGLFSALFQRSSVRAGLEYASGSILIALGARTALLSR